MSNVRLEALIASSPERYAETPVQLATDGARLRALRRDLRARVSASHLGSPAPFTRALEEAFRAMSPLRPLGSAGVSEPSAENELPPQAVERDQ